MNTPSTINVLLDDTVLAVVDGLVARGTIIGIDTIANRYTLLVYGHVKSVKLEDLISVVYRP